MNDASDGPFARSKVRPGMVEGLVAWAIWRHQGRGDPIGIAEIIRQEWPTGTERKVKEVVHDLRILHRCAIGARRSEPFGYFWISTPEDQEYALEPYRRQVVQMFRVLRAVDSRARLLELAGQLRLDELDAE